MMTQEIMSMAYADVFSIPVNENGRYHDQKLSDPKSGKEIVIDYAYFDARLSKNYDIDNDNIIAFTEDGCEGCWIAVYLSHVIDDDGARKWDRIGTVKTLDEGRSAWRAMGALAGELTFAAQRAAWKIYKASSEPEQKRREAISAFVAGVLMHGDVERVPMTYEDAFTALFRWTREDGVELPEGLTSRALMDEWNRQIAADNQH